MARYNVNAEWDDPFEAVRNRRNAPRFDFPIKLSITADVEGERTRLVGPAIVRNISQTGAYLDTKHALKPGQRVMVAIPTKRYPVRDVLPSTFMGPATVIRVTPDEGNRIRAAVRFGETLSQNMEFAMFVQDLQTIKKTLDV